LAFGRKVNYNCEMLRLSSIFIVVLVSFIISACSDRVTNDSNISRQPTNSGQTANSNAVRNDVEELGLRVSIPFETEELVWREFVEDKSIVAVMRFSIDDTAKIIVEAEKVRAPTRVDLSSETWFPPELIAQSDMTGDDRLSGNSYSAEKFLLPPFNDGSLIRVNNSDYFILRVAVR
jgi:hypothetical protein